MTEQGLQNQLSRPPPQHSGHLIRNLFYGSLVFGSALLLPSTGAYSQSQKWPAAADKSATTKIMEVGTMPIQKTQKNDQILSLNEMNATAIFYTGQSLSVGKYDDLNTRDHVITGNFVNIKTPDSNSKFRIRPYGGDATGLYIGADKNYGIADHLFMKPYGASYYGDYGANFTVLTGSGSSVEVVAHFDQNLMIRVGKKGDLNTRDHDVTGDFVVIATPGNNIRIEGQLVARIYAPTIDRENAHMYYKPVGASYYVETGTTNFQFVASVTGVMDRNTQIYSSIFNEVPKISPNPASQTATVRLNLDTQNEVFVRLYDANGQELMMKSVQGQGEHQVRLDVSGLSSGVYYAKIHDNFGHLMTTPLSVVK
jgi:hypothetical protein